MRQYGAGRLRGTRRRGRHPGASEISRTERPNQPKDGARRLETQTLQPTPKSEAGSVDAALPALYNLAPFPGGKDWGAVFAGSLQDFSAPLLLSLIRVARQTGTLILTGPDGRGELAFSEGRLAYGRMGAGDVPLAVRLRRVGWLGKDHLRALGARAGVASEKQAALTLINAGFMTQGEILEFIQAEAVEVYYQVAGWLEGEFQFDSSTPPQADALTAAIDTVELIAEGGRRRHETEQLYQKIPDLSLELRLPEWHADALGRYSLNTEEQRLVSSVAPGRTLAQIAETNGYSGLQIRRLTARMLQAGVVEVARASGARTHELLGERPATPGEVRGYTKSLVGRLFQRKRGT